jgi:hypothetical protein
MRRLEIELIKVGLGDLEKKLEKKVEGLKKDVCCLNRNKIDFESADWIRYLLNCKLQVCGGCSSYSTNHTKHYCTIQKTKPNNYVTGGDVNC